MMRGFGGWLLSPLKTNHSEETLLHLPSLGEVRVVPEEGVTPCKEFMIKNVIDPADTTGVNHVKSM